MKIYDGSAAHLLPSVSKFSTQGKPLGYKLNSELFQEVFGTGGRTKTYAINN